MSPMLGAGGEAQRWGKSAILSPPTVWEGGEGGDRALAAGAGVECGGGLLLVASMPHEIGPRWKISFCIASAPEIEPNSAIDALGYDERPTHSLPKVGQVRAVLSAEHFHEAEAQKPSFDSDEHAMYGFDVAYEMPSLPSEWIRW